MGCDIAMYAEVVRGNSWSLAESLEPNPAFDPQRPDDEPQWKPREIFRTRNHALFAILAGVGNPACASEPFQCIAPPRGLPDDLSKPLRLWHAQNDGDTWSESWLLLKEILEFDWNRPIQRQAKVDPRVAHLFPPNQRGFPSDRWPAGLGRGYCEEGPGVQVTWEETYAEAVGPAFFDETISRLSAFGPAAKVRVVFWFNY